MRESILKEILPDICAGCASVKRRRRSVCDQLHRSAGGTDNECCLPGNERGDVLA